MKRRSFLGSLLALTLPSVSGSEVIAPVLASVAPVGKVGADGWYHVALTRGVQGSVLYLNRQIVSDIEGITCDIDDRDTVSIAAGEQKLFEIPKGNYLPFGDGDFTIEFSCWISPEMKLAEDVRITKGVQREPATLFQFQAEDSKP